jgi:hypothetical protein
MTMYDKYFTKEQRERIPFLNGSTRHIAEWATIVARMQAFQDAGVAPETAQVQQAARDWMIMLERDTGGDAEQVLRIHAMQENEPAARERNGITAQLYEYVQQAFGAWRLALYAKYLTPGELAFMKANYGQRAREWVPLLARVSAHMRSGAAPHDAASQQLAREWMALFCTYAGTDTATHLRIREAHEKEPGLLTGTFVSDDIVTFIKSALMPQ